MCCKYLVPWVRRDKSHLKTLSVTHAASQIAVIQQQRGVVTWHERCSDTTLAPHFEGEASCITTTMSATSALFQHQQALVALCVCVSMYCAESSVLSVYT